MPKSMTKDMSTVDRQPVVTLLHSANGQFPFADAEQFAEARALGARWAHDVQRSLRQENRRAAGGWPGTLREAHSKVAWLLAQSPLTNSVIVAPQFTDELVKTVYASARATWLAHAETQDDDDWNVEP